jgi:hypothetical protein
MVFGFGKKVVKAGLIMRNWAKFLTAQSYLGSQPSLNNGLKPPLKSHLNFQTIMISGNIVKVT